MGIIGGETSEVVGEPYLSVDLGDYRGVFDDPYPISMYPKNPRLSMLSWLDGFQLVLTEDYYSADFFVDGWREFLTGSHRPVDKTGVLPLEEAAEHIIGELETALNESTDIGFPELEQFYDSLQKRVGVDANPDVRAVERNGFVHFDPDRRIPYDQDMYSRIDKRRCAELAELLNGKLPEWEDVERQVIPAAEDSG